MSQLLEAAEISIFLSSQKRFEDCTTKECSKRESGFDRNTIIIHRWGKTRWKTALTLWKSVLWQITIGGSEEILCCVNQPLLHLAITSCDVELSLLKVVVQIVESFYNNFSMITVQFLVLFDSIHLLYRLFLRIWKMGRLVFGLVVCSVILIVF